MLAIDHDRLFKELLTTFFAEFLELFFPKLAASLERDSLEFMPQEIFPNLLQGKVHIADLIAKARFKGKDAYFVIHVEHQSTAPSAFGGRFFRYYSAIFATKGLPVYPIVVYSHDAPKKAQPNVYRMAFADGEVLRFTYRVVQLNRLSWRRFLNSHNPVASALMAKMKVAERDRVRVKVECLRLMVTLQLDRARMRLIASFVDTYLNLDEVEGQRFNRSLAEAKLLPKERRKVMEIVTSWERKGIEKGRIEGLKEGRQEVREEALNALRAVFLNVVSVRFGISGDAIAAQVRRINSIDELQALTNRALTVKSFGELAL